MKKYFMWIAATAALLSCQDNKRENELMGNWIEVMPLSMDITEGVTLEKGNKATSIGMATLQYEQWKLLNDKLILDGKSIGNGQTINFSDTLKIVRLTSDSLILERQGGYQFSYYKVADLNSLKPFNVVDSLPKPDANAVLETRMYKGAIPVESCIEVKNELTIYNYQHSGDGVYKLSNIFLRPDGETPASNSYGRVYTLRGDASNPDAVVYQLVPSKEGSKMNLLNEGDTLLLLKDSLQKPEATATNTFTLQAN